MSTTKPAFGRVRAACRRSAALAAALAVAVLAAGCGTAAPSTVLAPPASDATAAVASAAPPRDAPAPGPTAAPTPDAALATTLEAVAAGFRDADPDAIRPHLHDPGSPFGRRWLDRARNLADVPLSHYELRLDPSLPDLATDDVRRRHGAGARVVYVVEEHALEGHDQRGPAQEDLFLTVVPYDDGAWRVADDTDAEPLGLISVDHLWDHGPVTLTAGHGFTAIHHPESGGAVGSLLAEAGRAREELEWPLDWDRTAPIIVPRDQDELGELLHVTFDLSNFVAFATSTATGELGGYELTGARIVVNPDRLLDRSSETRQRILAHELLHVATRPHAGPAVPSWLEEGVAQRLGERRSTTGTVLLGALGAGFEGALPRDFEFTTGGQDRIFLSYQLGWSFADYVARQHGAERLASFYRRVGRGSVGQPGRQEWHLDRAARTTFDLPFEDLRRAWAATLR